GAGRVGGEFEGEARTVVATQCHARLRLAVDLEGCAPAHVGEAGDRLRLERGGGGADEIELVRPGGDRPPRDLVGSDERVGRPPRTWDRARAPAGPAPRPAPAGPRPAGCCRPRGRDGPSAQRPRRRALRGPRPGHGRGTPRGTPGAPGPLAGFGPGPAAGDRR